MSGFFYNLGRRLGRRAVPAIRKSKLLYASVAGTEEEALRAERLLGRDLAAELRRTIALESDPALAALVNELCQRLAGRVRDKRRAFQCEVLHDPSFNAMALPGGFLFISNSLVEFCERRPEELAFVLGHEMGHVIRGHASDRLLSETALRAVSAVTMRASGSLSGWLQQQGLVLLRSAHAQEGELEADELGLRLAAAAGFPPAGAIALLRRLEAMSANPKGQGQYFATHPPPSERIARLAPLSRRLSEGR
jgi:beta-barrel assembly-enhancing protease